MRKSITKDTHEELKDLYKTTEMLKDKLLIALDSKIRAQGIIKKQNVVIKDLKAAIENSMLRYELICAKSGLNLDEALALSSIEEEEEE